MAAKKKFPYHSAFVACNGGCHEGNGDSSCSYGCIACGLCVNTCPYGAISMNEYGVAEVDEKKMYRLWTMCRSMSPADHPYP